jgi:hypothetical protein
MAVLPDQAVKDQDEASKNCVFFPVAMVPGDMVALARLGADGPASRDEGGPIIFRASMTHARNTKRNDFVVKTSLSCRGKSIS